VIIETCQGSSQAHSAIFNRFATETSLTSSLEAAVWPVLTPFGQGSPAFSMKGSSEAQNSDELIKDYP
jgi:hypothetical protein